MSGVTLNFDFRSCLIRSETVYNDAFYQDIIWNVNPLFENTVQGDFIFQTTSPLNGAGFTSSVLNDIFGNPRNNPPDIGAVEL